MSSRTKKQHVIPRFYLSRFCDAGGMVWTYAPNTEPLARKPEATAIETNFYTPMGEDGERLDLIETSLAEMESAAAPLWEDLMAGKVLTGEARETISIFLAAQDLRSPATVTGAAEMMGHMVHHVGKLLTSNKKAHDQSLDVYEAETGKTFSSEEREEMREFLRNPDNYKIEVLRSAGLPVLGAMERLATLFVNMKWVVGRSKDQHLITSDSPVTRTSDPSTHSRVYGDGAYVNETVRVSFPLSPDRMLEMRWWGKEREGVVEIPKRMARKMNTLRAQRAERFLYACQKDYGISKLSEKWLAGERTPKVKTSPDVPKIEVKRKLTSEGG